MTLVTRRTHIYAIVLFVIVMGSAGSVEGSTARLAGRLVGSYLMVILSQQLVRGVRHLVGSLRGGPAVDS